MYGTLTFVNSDEATQMMSTINKTNIPKTNLCCFVRPVKPNMVNCCCITSYQTKAIFIFILLDSGFLPEIIR